MEFAMIRSANLPAAGQIWMTYKGYFRVDGIEELLPTRFNCWKTPRKIVCGVLLDDQYCPLPDELNPHQRFSVHQMKGRNFRQVC
jgi:hypothetical protein